MNVCERSLHGTRASPSAAAASHFLRVEMLPSGYLIRPSLKCARGASTSPNIIVHKMTIAITQETSGEIVYRLGRQPAVLRTFSQRLSRGFNDAINRFNNDG
ncbi:unnamed protein product [Fraxinus pennsylvanica]|uniref:Uncharacterized protein n=1 Tax=Fraxinus pennsylvanica TaxID=56036 RepID=A0AAD2DIG0_9LAMI|nr:unnamed protein product [Fraxinus pennsylvanica]